MLWTIIHFQCYLYDNDFLLVTDHQLFKRLVESNKLTEKLAKWALMLQQYDFKVVYKTRLVNMDADGLSHNPCPTEADSIEV